jgi:hypothetical protein
MASQAVRPARKKSFLEALLNPPGISKPQLSLLILAATGFLSAAVMLVWLLLWMLPIRQANGIPGLWVVQRSLLAPLIGHPPEDLAQILTSSREASETDDSQTLLESLIKVQGGDTRTRVCYLWAAGVVDGQGAYFLPPVSGPLATWASADRRKELVTAKRLADYLGNQSSINTLLILDAGQIGSDRKLGVYAQGFLHDLCKELEPHLEKRPKGLAILSSCAPGQTSWNADFEGRSAFGYFVEQGLAGEARSVSPGGRLTAGTLRDYVSRSVADWARRSRQAVQTPVLWGDADIPLKVRATSSSSRLKQVAKKDDEQEKRKKEEEDELSRRLIERWSYRDQLAKNTLYRHAPRDWQRYLETLLRAEQLYRLGEFTEAHKTIDDLDKLKVELDTVLAGESIKSPWSLALLERNLARRPDDSEKGLLNAMNKKINEALAELIREEEIETLADDQALANPGAASAGPPAGKDAGPGASSAPVTKASQKTQPPAPAAPSAKDERPAQGELQSRSKKVSAFTELTENGDPRFVEAQLLVWADTFVKRAGAASPFRGGRGDLLKRALQSRRLAEQAAAADPRVVRWIMPLVEAGDKKRRQAQDALFACEERAFPEQKELLDKADADYERAREIGDSCLAAFDLLEQLQAELPYLGEWKARRDDASEPGIGRDFLDLMSETAALARLLQDDADGGQGPVPIGSSEDDLPTHLEHVEQWKDRASRVKRGWTRLWSEFEAKCKGLAESGGEGRWREIDSVLAVPLIPSDRRKELLGKLRSGRLAREPQTATTQRSSESEATDLRSFARQRLERGQADRPEKDSDSFSADAGADICSFDHDPKYWSYAFGLLQLERGLLEIGGVSQEDLKRFEEDVQNCRKGVGSAKQEPERAFEAYKVGSQTARDLRATLVKQIRAAENEGRGNLASADRACRILPLSETLGLARDPTADLDQLRRLTLLIWHGGRLLQDFAPHHADRLFRDAQKLYETAALKAAHSEAELMGRARLLINTEPAQELTLNGWSDQTMSVLASSTSHVPAGEAVVLVVHGQSDPLSVTEQTTKRNSLQGILATVQPEKKEKLDFSVSRTEATLDKVKVVLTPLAFYRGRLFDSAASGLQALLVPAKEPVSVTILEMDTRRPKPHTDQFKEHPGKGYMHSTRGLAYRLALSLSDDFVKPIRVWVRYGLEGMPKPARVIELKPGQVNEELTGLVEPKDVPPESPKDVIVEVRKDNADGPKLSGRQYPFHHTKPPHYVHVNAYFVKEWAGEWPGAPGVEYHGPAAVVEIKHLREEVTGPVKLRVTIGSYTFEEKEEPRNAPGWRHAWPLPEPVPAEVPWHVEVEGIPGALNGKIVTGVAPKPPQPPAPPPG